MTATSIAGRRWILVLALLLFAANAWAQQPPDPNKKPEGSKAGEAPDPMNPPPEGHGRDGKDPHDVDLDKVKLLLNDNKFAFHLRDLADKEGASTDYWGRVLLVYVVSPRVTAAYLDELKGLKDLTEKFGGSLSIVAILLTEAQEDGSHLKEAKEVVAKHHLPGERFFLGNRSIQKQLTRNDFPMPWWILLGRDGSVVSSTYAWFRKLPERYAPLVAKACAAPKPAGKKPAPPAMEEVKPAQIYKDPNTMDPPDPEPQ